MFVFDFLESFKILLNKLFVTINMKSYLDTLYQVSDWLVEIGVLLQSTLLKFCSLYICSFSPKSPTWDKLFRGHLWEKDLWLWYMNGSTIEVFTWYPHSWSVRLYVVPSEHWISTFVNPANLLSRWAPESFAWLSKKIQFIPQKKFSQA